MRRTASSRPCRTPVGRVPSCSGGSTGIGARSAATSQGSSSIGCSPPGHSTTSTSSRGRRPARNGAASVGSTRASSSLALSPASSGCRVAVCSIATRLLRRPVGLVPNASQGRHSWRGRGSTASGSSSSTMSSRPARRSPLQRRRSTTVVRWLGLLPWRRHPIVGVPRSSRSVARPRRPPRDARLNPVALPVRLVSRR